MLTAREQQLLAVAAEIQRQIDTELTRDEAEELGPGVVNGYAEVESFVHHGELGVGYEHLVYMIEASEISISREHEAILEELARGMGLRAPHHKEPFPRPPGWSHDF